jgi:MerR family transcriptional regulator, copper efflux regulator
MKNSPRAATAPLSTGGLCERAGITRGALRTYEALGLIEPTRRSAAGYREYTADAVDRLAVIRSAKAMGLTLQEVRELLPLLEPERYSRAKLLALVKKHLARLDVQMAQLAAIRQVLSAVMTDPDRLTSPDCDLVAELAGTAAQPKKGKSA